MKRLVVPCGNQINLLNQQLLKEYPGLPKEVLSSVITEPFLSQILESGNQYLINLIDNLTLSNFHKEEYLDSFNIFPNNEDVYIEFHGVSWVVDAMENGHPGYDIKERFLNSPKAKISKAGNRYRSIPMKKDITEHSSLRSGIKASDSIEKIRQVVQNRFKHLIATMPTAEPALLNSPRYDYKSEYFALDVTDRIGKDPVIERVRTYRKQDREVSNEAFVEWKTISEKDGNTWDHPGFLAVMAADSLQVYLLFMADKIKSEIESIF